MANWYTADTHFGHANIIGHCDRPFADASEMDTEIIRNIRERVKPGDDLWIIGDFAFGPPARSESYCRGVFEQLPGRKHLIVGNHDFKQTRSLPWTSVREIVELRDGGQALVLCHYPMLTWNRARNGALQLFGHVHNNWQGTRNSVNVGVDVWGFNPIQLPEILERAQSLPVNSYWKSVERNAEDP